jgi:hypothetical protein
MNEFKFSCPNCRQNIQATPEYAGVQINCPHCQAAIIVPQPSAASVPRPSRLSMARSTVQHAATSPVMAQAIVRQAKKPRIGLYVGWGVGAVVAVVAILLVPKAMDKYQQHKDAVAAAKAAAEAPPPPPPDLEANEILKNLGETYKGLSSYSTQGESVETVDMSQINPMSVAPQVFTTKLSILLGRGGHFRIEWDRQIGPKNIKGAAWSAGKGDFVRTGTATTKARNWESALSMAAASSGTLGVGLAELFFHSTNNFAVSLKNYSKTNNETLNGEKCYVLTGQIGPQKVLLWIHKNDFLIARAEIVLGGKVEEAAMASLTPAQKKAMEMMSKMKGNIIETYDDIETNKVLDASAFQEAFVPNANPKHKRTGKHPAPGDPARANPQ